MSIELVMPSNYLILCHPLLLLPSIFPSIRVFSNESALRIRWPKYWSFSFNVSPSNERPGLISFRMDWLGLLVVQGTLRVFSNTTTMQFSHNYTYIPSLANSLPSPLPISPGHHRTPDWAPCVTQQLLTNIQLTPDSLYMLMLPSPFIPLSASPTMSHYLNLHPYSVPHHCKWVHQYFSGFRFIPFCGWVIFHCIYVAHLLYLFFCQQTSRLLPCPGYCKQCCDEQWGTRNFLIWFSF